MNTPDDSVEKPLASSENGRVEHSYPTVPTQRGILFQALHGENTGLYHAQMMFEIAQDLDIGVFRESWARVTERHAALRTSFREASSDEPVHVVRESVEVPLEYEDRRDLSEEQSASERLSRLRRDHELGFSEAPLWRLHLVRLEERRYEVLWSLHYAIMDGQSQAKVLREVEWFYDHLLAQRAFDEPPAARFQDYVDWWNGQDPDRSEAFWREELRSVPSARPLPVELRPSPAENAPPKDRRIVGDQVSVVLDERETTHLRDVGQRHGLELSTLVQGAWAFLLSRYQGTEDVVLGVTTPGRSADLLGIEDMVGTLINTLPLRVDLPASMTCVEWLRDLQGRYARLHEHEYSSLLKIQQWSGIDSGESLFETVVTVEEPEDDPGPRSLRMVRTWEESHAGYPLSLVATLGETLVLTVHYDTARFGPEAVERLVGHLHRVLREFGHGPQARLGEVPLLTPAEFSQLVHEWNDTDTSYSRDACIHDLFERQAEATPEALALLFEDERWTYREVNERANQVAHFLEHLGIERGDHVAILTERSAEMIPALLGVLKAGATYVPLDANAPVKRWHWILDSLRITCVLTETDLVPHLLAADPLPNLAHIMCLDSGTGDEGPDPEPTCAVHSSDEVADMPRDNLPARGGPQDIAYIIFTSGSTGTPKGVTVAHFPAVNLIEWVNTTFSVGPEDRLLFVTALTFDLSVYDVFGILAAGGSIRVATGRDIQEPANLLSYISREPITFWDSAPAALMQLVPFLPTDADGVVESVADSVRLVFMSGDWIPLQSPDVLTAAFPNVQVVGLGGATEATVWSNYFPVGEVDPAWSSIPYGKPIQNSSYYVLDESLRSCPIDVPGDLYIGGTCLSTCYANAPELTATKYVPSPFSAVPGDRIYKTGDMARWRPDGNLEFLGRTDSQVKIRGYRVELGEIDSVLNEHPAIQDSVTIVREDRPGDQTLVSYVIAHPLLAQSAVQEHDGALADKRVDRWREVYDSFDPGAATEDGHDFSGWNSSYTGRPIPLEEMRAWQEETVALVRDHDPRTVLEIGCGAGLLLFPLAPDCHRYHGTDLSTSALESVRSRLDARPELRETVHLSQGEADGVKDLRLDPVDTVIINSVVQYFPGIDYLVRVLEGALARVADGGRIIVGDVRSLPLLEAFHASVETHRAPGTMTREHLWQRVQHRVRQEEELVLDPAFFRDWAAGTGAVSRVEIRPKGGSHLNELSMFRYQVVLHVGADHRAEAEHPEPNGPDHDWTAEQLTLAQLREMLDGDRPDRIRLLDVTNSRVDEAVRTLRWLKGDSGAETVEGRHAQAEPRRGVDPDEIRECAERAGYRATIDWGDHGPDGSFTVLLTRDRIESATAQENHRELPALEAREIHDRSNQEIQYWSNYANQPLKAEIHDLLMPRLQAYLAERLPGYMVPSDLVALDALPVTSSGKLDRRALLNPKDSVSPGTTGHVPARNTTEALLVSVWEQTLGRSPIGVLHNFFELGGHSLLAAQMATRIRQVFSLEVPVRLFFELPTIAEVARELQRRQEELQPLETRPLAQVPRDGALPAGFDQQRLFFIDRLNPGTTSYTVNWLVPLPTSLAETVIRDALNEMVRRHESLRTTLREEDGLVWQVIADDPPVVLPTTDLATLSEEEAEKQAQEEIRRWWDQPFDLGEGPLLRARLIKLSETDQVMALSAHHTVFDGYSIGLFCQEFLQICRALAVGEPSPLPEVEVQYADYAVGQQSWLEKDRLAFHLDYWKGQLSEAPELLTLPTDFPRPDEQSLKGDFLRRRLSAETTRQVAHLSREYQVTNYITMLSAFAVFLSRYSGQNVVVIGVPIANRNRADLESMIGFLVSTVAISVDLRDNPRFEDVLLQVRKQMFDAQSHQEVPFERLVEALRPARSLGYNPVFQAMFADESLPFLEHESALVQPKPWMHSLVEQGMSVGVSRFDLTCMIQSSPEGMRFGFEYSTDLFGEQTVAHMADHFRVLVESALAAPEQRVQHLPMVEETDRRTITETGRGAVNTAALGPVSLPELFGERVRRCPDRVAVVFGDRQLTYAALDRWSNRLAHVLRDRGVGRGSLVGLCLPRSVEMVVGLLAILKAGGAYVPLDPTYPRERVEFMAADAGLRVVVAGRSVLEVLSEVGASVVVVEDVWSELAGWSDAPPESGVVSEDLAYVMYTSGSTGRPKGVAVTHADVAALALDSRFAQGHERVLLHSPQAFDASTYELWVPLLSSGRIVVAPTEPMTPELLRDAVTEHKVSVVWLTAALFHLFAQEDPEAFAGLGEVWTGGDAVRADAVARVRAACPELVVVDGYGPTETTTFATTYRMEPQADVPATVPIGRPLDNTSVYILDGSLQPVPVGVVGELCIAGAGLARGYLHRPDLTAQSFVANPFGENPGDRLYKTGDLARFLPDGTIEVLGRVDEQVKIRGFRVELGEIESVLTQHPDVRNAAVLLHVEGVVKRLVAHITTRGPVDSPELQAFLGQRLPDYMVPGVFVSWEELPLTPNGKVDRTTLAALPLDEQTGSSSEHVAARTPVEESLAQIWREVLSLGRPVGVHDSFFALGGDSIVSLQVVFRAKQHGLYFTVKQLFECQTIAELAPVVEQRRAQQVEAPQNTITGPVELTPIQRWFFGQGFVRPDHVNQSVLLRVGDDLSGAQWQEVVRCLVEHHDVLRSRFLEEGGRWRAELMPMPAVVPWQEHDVSALPWGERQERMLQIAGRVQSDLDISQAPLVRAALFTGMDEPDSAPGSAAESVPAPAPGSGPAPSSLGFEGRNRLLLVAHHLVVDVVSWRLILEDLAALTEQMRLGRELSLPAKTSSWQQWAARLQQESLSEVTSAELSYWSEQSAPVRALPVDGSLEGNTVGNSSVYEAVLDQAQVRALLQDVPAAFNTRINDALLTALACAVGEWTQDSHVRVDLEGHGREDLFEEIDVSRTVGWFTTISPVRIPVPGLDDLSEGLKRTKELLRGRPRQGVGYGLLAHGTGRGSDVLGPPAQISFNYLGQFDSSAGGGFAALSDQAGPDWDLNNERPYVVDVVSHVQDGQLRMRWTYHSTAFGENTVRRVAEQTLEVLVRLIEEARRPDVVVYSPSDLPASGLDQERINDLVGELRLLPRWRAGSVLRPLEDCYPQTPIQQGLWFQSQLSQGEGVYHVQMILDIDQELDVEVFRESWAQVMRLHPILRTGFLTTRDNDALQLVWSEVEVPLRVQDWRSRDSGRQQELLEEYLVQDRVRGFASDETPQWRMLLARTGDERYQLIWSAHHAILDGWSISLILDEAVQWYGAFVRGDHLARTPARPYRDYVAWLRDQDMGRAEEYWRRALAGVEQATPLNVGGRSEAVVDGFVPPAVVSVGFGDDESVRLADFARRNGLTLNTVLQGCWALLLSRYSGSDDVVFGTVVSGRPAEVEGVERTVGLFINTLPLRVRVPERVDVLSWLRGLQEQNTLMREYEYSPLHQIQRWSGLPVNAALFESLFVFENYPENDRGEEELHFTDVSSREQTHYPLNLVVTLEERLAINLFYDSRRFDARTAETVLAHMRQICRDLLVAAPQEHLAKVSVLTEGERTRALDEWSVDTVASTEDTYLHELIEDRARETPDAIAVVHEDGHLSYGELNGRANQLAHWLQRNGVGPEDLVGLCLERSLEAIVGLLGILKAGGAYLPLDPRIPADRMAFVLEDARVSLFLTQAHLLPSLETGDRRTLCLDSEWAVVSAESVEKPSTTLTQENLAYIIYTSGSTGRPKGVMVAHRCIQHIVPWISRHPCFDKPQNVLQVASLSFDFSVWEILLPLVTGGTLHIPRHDTRMIGTDLHDLLDERAIEILSFTPGALATLPTEDPLPDLRTLVVGGEAYSADLIRAWAPGRTFFNVYGPTETTVFATGAPTDEYLDTIHIGRPITNVRTYVLDSRMQPVPVGVPGELYIGGIGVTRGYMNRPDLTAESFVADPFSAEPGSRLYKSGDTVRYLADGNIEFVGRLDGQVKIRGFRMELGEIQTVLHQHELVQSCAVLAQPDGASKRLVAYVALEGKDRDITETLRAHLKKQLPSYMVPSDFVYLDELPLTSNGKLNQRELPLPEEGSVPTLSDGALPRTRTEALLAEIWEEVLERGPIGIFDDFFGLGGHSLVAVKVTARVQQAFGVELPVRVLFERPTVAAVAAELDRLVREQGPYETAPLVRVTRDEPIPATFDQQRVWYMERLHPDSPLYTVGWLLHRPTAVDSARLRRALEALVARHETLRTTFRERRGRVWQEIADPGTVLLSEADLSGEPEERRPELVKELTRELWSRPFDLAEGPLFRTMLIHLSDSEALLAFSGHHAIVDGFSIRILDEELLQTYDALGTDSPVMPAPLEVQYADYAVWQQQWLREEHLQEHLRFWKEHLEQAPALLSLPTDHPRPAVQDHRGANYTCSLPAELNERLVQLSGEHRTTHFIAVLSAFAILLSRYSGQDKVTIGIPVANRNRVETEPLIGFLVNTVALCVDLRGAPTFTEVLQQVRWSLLEAQSHQEVPFERIVEELKPERSLSYNPVFQVMFTGLDKLFDDAPEEQGQPAWLQDVTDAGNGVSKFDLGLSIRQRDGELKFNFEYSTGLFEQDTIAGMGEHLRHLIEEALAAPRTPVARLGLLSAAEREEIVAGRNATDDEDALRPVCLHQLFEEQVRRTPDRIALSFEDQQLSYAELDRRANRLARTLRDYGVGPETHVGVCMHRSLDLEVSLLAVLKAGGAYIPLDPDHPSERLAFIAKDARVVVALTGPGTSEHAEVLRERGVRLIELGGGDTAWLDASPEPLEVAVNPDNLAYVIYTSGSTGRPKGAMSSHRGICNRLLWMQDAYDLRAHDRVLQKTPYSFDVSVWEFFWPVITGARLHIARPEGHRDPAYLAELIEEQAISVLHFVPSMLQAFLQRPDTTRHCEGVRHVVCSGEALPLDVQERFQQALPNTRLHNLYGPTEASVDVSFWECRNIPGASTVPIGRPVANTRLYVLDEAMAPVPDGVIGELYIGGVQLARGYSGRPDLTAERFVADPFGHARLYATGDLARYRPDGTIEYAGRKDHQIKIRGYRIEIEEIEAVLAEHPAVRSSLVVVHEAGPTDKRLIAFHTARAGQDATPDELRGHLLERLPEYMVPAFFVRLEEFPLSPNGKVDRKALPSLSEIVRQTQDDVGYVAPRTDTEKVLAELWATLLGVEQVGVQEDFFALGGHSLLVASMSTEVQERWGIALMLPTVFQNRTIEALAHVIDHSGDHREEEADAAELFDLL